MGCGASAAKYSPDDKAAAGTKGGTAGGGNGEMSKQQHKQGNADFQETMKFLTQVPLLKALPVDQQPILASACENVQFQVGDQLMKQGEEGHEMFLIKKGKATVFVSQDGGDPERVAELGSGDYVGHQALLSSEPRSATVRADAPIEAVKITRAKFQDLKLHEKVQFANRKAVAGGGNVNKETAKPPSPKTEEERQLLAKALRDNENLSTMVLLDEDRINQLINVAWKEEVIAGTDVIVEGDIVADHFYMVMEGSFEISVEGGVVSSAGPGGSFGELALLYLVPRAATVKATSNAVLFVIDRGNFKEILMKTTNAQMDMYVELLSRVEVLNPLLMEEKKDIAKAMVEMHFTQGEIILQQGDSGCTFYIMYEGEVAILVDNAEVSRMNASIQRGECQFFGERALLEDQPRAATVAVVSETAKVLALDRRSFDMLLGPLQDLLAQASEGGQRQATRKLGMPTKGGGTVGTVNVARTDLKKIGLLGCGGFGAVELWEHKTTGETFALKGLSKGFIVRTGMQEAVHHEKNILMMTNSPFIIKLYATFNSPQTLYFLLEPALGGELYQTYSRKGLHGSEKHARYYVAGVVFAFEHMHERMIIYRDLKPENLLFTDKGHVKLTDMGLAKFVVGKTFTTCGTPDYFAPELIKSTGHTVAVDWWTLGILLYELLCGKPPFESAYPMQIYSKVLKGVDKMVFPSQCHGAADNLVRSLLEKDPEKRLPMRSGGTKNIKSHTWYTNFRPDSHHPGGKFDWDAMFQGTMTPPYRPTVKSKTDIANFSARKEDMPRQIEYRDDGSGWDRDFATH